MKEQENSLHAMLLQSRLQQKTPLGKNADTKQSDPHLPLPLLHHFLLEMYRKQQIYNFSLARCPVIRYSQVTALYLSIVHAVCVWVIFYSEISFIENICLKFT